MYAYMYIAIYTTYLPIDPVPSMMAVTVALAFWLFLNDLCVPCSYNENILKIHTCGYE